MPTKLTVPNTVAVTATPQQVAFSPAGSSVYTLRNDSATYSIFYIHDSVTYPGANIAAFVGASQSDMKDLFASEIRAGESVVIDNMPPSIIVVCITGGTATLNVEAGEISGDAGPATEAKQDSILAAAQGTIGSAMTSVSVDLDANAAAQELVAAPAAGHQLWVYGFELHADISGSYQFLSAATAKTGIMPVGALGGVARDSAYPIFKCATAEALNIKSVTCACDGVVTYRDVTL